MVGLPSSPIFVKLNYLNKVTFSIYLYSFWTKLEFFFLHNTRLKKKAKKIAEEVEIDNGKKNQNNYRNMYYIALWIAKES